MENNITEKQENSEKKKKLKTTKKHWQIFSAILGILFIISILTTGFHFGVSKKTIKNTIEELSGATVLSVEKEKGLYKANIEDEEGNEGIIYITKDGKLLFQGAIDVEKLRKYLETIRAMQDTTGSATRKPKMTCDDIPKKDNPELNAFVVSYCPFGTQMQRILIEVAKLFNDNIKVRYIGSIVDGKVTSMHGEVEATENLRQICIREEQQDKYWNYVKCFIDKKDSEVCLTETNIDKEKLQTCMKDATKGIKYAEEDFKLQDKHNIRGSPTLILNGIQVSEFDFGGRNPEAVKTLLCCGFKEQPEECKETLETTSTGAKGQC